MKTLSRIASNVRASTTVAIDTLYKKMRADGIDVIGFGAGEPDFATPENIKQAAIHAIETNFTKYTAVAGTEGLRKAIAGRLWEDYGVSYKQDQIVVTSGAKHNVFVALMTLLNPGDEVILPAPYWVSYYELIMMAGGVPVVIEAREEAGFKITAEQVRAAITEKTKAIILNSPSNPTGMIYTREELVGICGVCLENEIYIISDEIYCKLTYDGKQFTSVASISEDIKDITILINGASKSYAMTGWRIGFAAANERISNIMANYLSHSTSAASSISQMAAQEAFGGPQDSVEKMRLAFEERRNYIVERISAIPGVSCLKPEGAFYVMMNISQLIGKELYGTEITDSDSFATMFLKKGLVAVVPGTGFGAPNYVRWSYATSMENIKQGMDRLEKFLMG
jgi:aspartate aminotransferase